MDRVGSGVGSWYALGTDVALVVAGEGKRKAALQRKIRNLNIPL